MAERNAPMLKAASLCASFSMFRGILQPLRPGPWCPSHSQSSDILVLTKEWLTSALIKHVLNCPERHCFFNNISSAGFNLARFKDSGPYVPFSECAAGQAQLSIRRAGALNPACMRIARDVFLSLGSVCADLCSVYRSKSQSTCGPSNLRHSSNLVRSRVLGIH